MKKQNTVIRVEKDSIAEELGIEVGDILLDINGCEVKDVFDYRYLIQDENIIVGIEKPDGEQWSLEIEKDEFEDLGFVFESGLMDKAKSCSNKCIFCFIDQLPKGMRKELYFKDDDSRLSFLHGNYVTLTNMRQEDIDRIIFYHLSPINISVHTTNPELRCKMLKNKNATRIFDYLEQLSQSGIQMNFQVVLCRGYNDGAELDRTITDLSKYMESSLSLCIVPFGKTNYREGLEQIELFDKETASVVIDRVEGFQKEFVEKYGRRFCFLSDEFYIMAERALPDYDFYEGFPQLENGVGMVTLLITELEEALDEAKADDKKRELSFACGRLVYKYISLLCKKIEKKFKNTLIHTYCIENDYFGRTITVSGLITGSDLTNQLKGKPLGTHLFITENAFMNDTDLMLDDYTVSDVEKLLDVKLVKASDNGAELLKQVLSAEG